MKDLPFDEYKFGEPEEGEPLRWLIRHWVTSALDEAQVSVRGQEAILKMFDIAVRASYEEGVFAVTTTLGNISLANCTGPDRGVESMLGQFRDVIKAYREDNEGV